MGDVSVDYIFMAMLPAFIITCLFWFDHGVASLLAQQSRFGLERCVLVLCVLACMHAFWVA